MLFAVTVAMAQQFTEKITKKLNFEKESETNVVIVANINGNVKVEGYNGNEIMVTVEKKIMAKNQDRLEEGKKDIQLGIINLSDSLILYVEGACSRFGRKNQEYHRNKKERKGWDYDWSSSEEACWEDFQFLMHFTISVPASVNLVVSTINNGEIEVNNLTGHVSANNVNGGIQLTAIAGPTDVSSINGGIRLEYASNPSGPCRFYALNGDIKATFKRGLDATVGFESFNGNFFTNVDTIEHLPAILEKEQSKAGIQYKLTGNRYKVGRGGALLDFETFNGNVYLNEL